MIKHPLLNREAASALAKAKLDEFRRILSPYPNRIQDRNVILKAWKGASRKMSIQTGVSEGDQQDF